MGGGGGGVSRSVRDFILTKNPNLKKTVFGRQGVGGCGWREGGSGSAASRSKYYLYIIIHETS